MALGKHRDEGTTARQRADQGKPSRSSLGTFSTVRGTTTWTEATSVHHSPPWPGTLASPSRVSPETHPRFLLDARIQFEHHGATVLSSTDVVVIGAGPNGLSVGAHLGHAGIEHRVFGHTMGAWRSNMPAGMILKSEPYASDLSAPGIGFLARDYCVQASEVYHERVIPLSREQFIAYGSWFARQLVPDVEETEITSLSQAPSGGFLLRTANGEQMRAARVVVATGIIPFAFLPPDCQHYLPISSPTRPSTQTSLSSAARKSS